MYNAIKSQQILQPLGSSFGARASTSSLSPGGNILRNRSMRGQQPDRLMTLKRGSIRGLQSIMGAPTGPSPYSSNSSIDGRASPSPSFATSINEVRDVIQLYMVEIRSKWVPSGRAYLQLVFPNTYIRFRLQPLAHHHTGSTRG